MNHATSFHENDLLYSEQFGDHYYSRNDGRAETAHVFIAGNDLPDRWKICDTFTIGELGFGTGLNFLETWSCWIENRKPEQQLKFISLEGFPLTKETASRALSRWPELTEHSNRLLENWENLSQPVQLDNQTMLHVVQDLVETALEQFPPIDAWYLDGFAPSKNTDMWSADVLMKIGSLTPKGGRCASYTSAGWVRRNLQEAGFKIEKRQGFGTKRHMISGVKQ